MLLLLQQTERYPFSSGNFDSSLTITQMAYPSCSRHVVLDVLQLSSTKGIEMNVFFFICFSGFRSFFFFLDDVVLEKDIVG